MYKYHTVQMNNPSSLPTCRGTQLAHWPRSLKCDALLTPLVIVLHTKGSMVKFAVTRYRLCLVRLLESCLQTNSALILTQII